MAKTQTKECAWCNTEGECKLKNSKEPCSWKKIPKTIIGIRQEIMNLENNLNQISTDIKLSKDKQEMNKKGHLMQDYMTGMIELTNILLKEYKINQKINLDTARKYMEAMIHLKKHNR